MKLKLLIVTTLIFTSLIAGQNINDEKLIGEWEAVNVNIPNAEEVPQKEALKLVEDAFLNSKFNFKGNRIFRIQFGKLADDRMKELLSLDNQNWVIKNDQILIGSEKDGFSSMQILFQENNGKTYFILPMIQLEMQKISDDQPSKPKKIESEKKEKIDYSKTELPEKDIKSTEIVSFKETDNPPLAPDCKEKWNTEKKKECTSKFIQLHVVRNFNTDLAAEIGLTGTLKILIEFIIDENGKPVNIHAYGGPKIMTQNAIEVIGLLPDLKPGIRDGKPVNVSYELPIVFRIQD